MMKTHLHRIVALVVSVAVLSSCSADQPTAVVPRLSPAAAPSGDLLSALTAQISVNGLQRRVPLAAPITVSKSIGFYGGTLSIPEAGVTVTVPSGALSGATTITMTARAGSLVAYDFAPHGVKFATPLSFTQDLHGTNATLLSAALLQLGYYSDGSKLASTSGLIDELRSGITNTLAWTFTSSIAHFSGYMVTCGRI